MSWLSCQSGTNPSTQNVCMTAIVAIDTDVT